jgi:MFS transporter, OPA family, glycerol-3-phosphate transporter
MVEFKVSDHPKGYRLRRFLNWFPLGLAYAFFYMGRYNLTVSKSALGDQMTKAEFGDIFAYGAWAYAISFLITGPLVDRWGGRIGMLIGTAGTIVMNLAMGTVLFGITNWGWNFPIFGTFVVLYILNMHFQSYGAISIVTIKAPWFHVRERGSFSTIFGWMITLGVYFAFDWGFALVDATRATISKELGFFSNLFQVILGSGNTGADQNWWLFFVPAIILTSLWLVMFKWMRNSPSEAGFENFETGEASLNQSGETEPIRTVFWKVVTHPVLFWVCLVEFCSGILRNGVMHWYPIFAKQVGFKYDFFVSKNWGLSLLMGGIIGALLTGWASDKFFGSRRAPMATIMYVIILIGIIVMIYTVDNPQLWYTGSMVIVISMAVIGVHGIFSGTSTADFAGTKNTGAAVGIVDGIVYLGAGIQSVAIGSYFSPTGDAAKDPANWSAWPIFLAPFACLGIIFAARIWNAIPKPKQVVLVETEPEVKALEADRITSQS